MILLSEFGQKLINLLLLNIQQNYYLRDNKSSIRPEARQQLIKIIAYLKIMVPFLERLHRVIFYWTGYYGQLSKRTTGIQYVSTLIFHVCFVSTRLTLPSEILFVVFFSSFI